MKSKGLITGLMLLLTLPLVNCGGGGGGGGTTPGNTGVNITSVEVTGTQEIDITAAGDVTVGFSIAAAQQGAVNPFPAPVDSCTITYAPTPGVGDSPTILAYSDAAPNCTIIDGTATCPSINLIDASRKQAFADFIAANGAPSEYPTHYTARYVCKYGSQIANNGRFEAAFDITLGIPANMLAVTPNSATIAPTGTKTFTISLGVPPYAISDEADPTGLVTVDLAGNSITVNGDNNGTGSVTITVQDSTLPVPNTKSFTVTVQ